MVRIQPSITIDLGKAGQKLTLEIEEAKELYNTLAKFLKMGSSNSSWQSSSHSGAADPTANVAIRKGRRGRGRKPSKTSFSISEAKTKEILEHINKQLSDTKPRTLTNLLKGVSYVPNHIPLIRQAVENQDKIAKKKIGKRTYYLRKQSPPKAAATS
jgi:hypothetical protein